MTRCLFVQVLVPAHRLVGQSPLLDEVFRRLLVGDLVRRRLAVLERVHERVAHLVLSVFTEFSTLRSLFSVCSSCPSPFGVVLSAKFKACSARALVPARGKRPRYPRVYLDGSIL